MMAQPAGALPRDPNGTGRSRSSGTECARSRYVKPGRLRLESRNLQRHHRRVPGGARRGPRRSACTRRCSTARSSPSTTAAGPASSALAAPDARDLAVADRGATRASTPVVYAIFDLLYLDGHSLMELPYRERRASARVARALRARRGASRPTHPGEAQAAARRDRQAGARGDRRQAPRLSLRARPARRQLAEDQAHDAPGARDRRVDAGGGAADEADRGAADGLLRGRKAPLRRPRRHRLHREDARPTSQKRLEPLRRETSPFDGRRRSCLAKPCSSSRSWWRRSSSASGRPSGSCAHRRSRACARTSRRARCDRGIGEDAEASGRQSRSELPEALFDEVERLPEGALLASDRRPAARRSRTGTRCCIPRPGSPRAIWSPTTRASLRRVLPHLHDRPLTLKRYPNGVDRAVLLREAVALAPTRIGSTTRQDRRHQLHTGPGPPDADLARRTWPTSSCTPRSSLQDRVDRPTMMVFDLDPGAPAGLVECCEVALVLRGLFEQLGLRSVAKTSGSKGLQMYVPLNAPTDIPHHEAVQQARGRAPRAAHARDRRVADDQATAARQGAGRLEPER